MTKNQTMSFCAMDIPLPRMRNLEKKLSNV